MIGATNGLMPLGNDSFVPLACASDAVVEAFVVRGLEVVRVMHFELPACFTTHLNTTRIPRAQSASSATSSRTLPCSLLNRSRASASASAVSSRVSALFPAFTLIAVPGMVVPFPASTSNLL